MHKGNKGDQHAGLHYQCVIEVSGNINANANIKSISDKIKNGNYNTYTYSTYTQVARMTFCFSRVAFRLSNLDGPVLDQSGYLDSSAWKDITPGKPFPFAPQSAKRGERLRN